MTLFAPDVLPLDDLLKLENRLREISALQTARANGPAGAQFDDDRMGSSSRELLLAPAQPEIFANQAVERPVVESTEDESQRLLSGLEEPPVRPRQNHHRNRWHRDSDQIADVQTRGQRPMATRSLLESVRILSTTVGSAVQHVRR